MLLVKQHQGCPSFYVVGHYEYLYVCVTAEVNYILLTIKNTDILAVIYISTGQ